MLKSVLAASGALLLASVAIPVNAKTVVVTGNPLANVKLLESPSAVIKDGVRVR